MTVKEMVSSNFSFLKGSLVALVSAASAILVLDYIPILMGIETTGGLQYLFCFVGVASLICSVFSLLIYAYWKSVLTDTNGDIEIEKIS